MCVLGLLNPFGARLLDYPSPPVAAVLDLLVTLSTAINTLRTSIPSWCSNITSYVAREVLSTVLFMKHYAIIDHDGRRLYAVRAITPK
jgi:hypothetical protein